jgi:hypothetical protein
MLGAPILHLWIIALSIVGGIGNLIVAFWYIWKKRKWALAFLHIATAAFSFLMSFTVISLSR